MIQRFTCFRCGVRNVTLDPGWNQDSSLREWLAEPGRDAGPKLWSNGTLYQARQHTTHVYHCSLSRKWYMSAIFLKHAASFNAQKDGGIIGKAALCSSFAIFAAACVQVQSSMAT